MKQSRLARFTPTQRAVARHMIAGLTIRDMAKVMGRHKGTIERHCDDIRLRMGVPTLRLALIELVRWDERGEA